MNIKVIVRDKHTLVLEMDAKKGDTIDLTQLETVDLSFLEDLLTKEKDKIYNEKLKNIEKEYQAKIENIKLQIKNDFNDSINIKEKEIQNLNNKIKEKENERINALKSQESSFEIKYTKELEALKNENKSLKDNKNIEIDYIKKDYELKLNEALNKNKDNFINKENNYVKEINDLKNKIENNKYETNNLLLTKENELKEKFEKEISLLTDQLNEKDKEINKLTYAKSVRNVKQIGEDLETWCDSLVFSYFQNGFTNCKWIKDNKVIKDEDESKGSKADYILEIFADDKKELLLTNICFDMKDENPDSKNKLKNSKYYPQLDKNRNKKNCKYAVLVSNLERDNDIPMFKVNEYEDMYVVRPEYLMTFINLIVSLNTKFKDLILKEKKENDQFIESKELIDEFESLKNKYLDKPLETLTKKVEDISKNADSIIKSAENIKQLKRDIVSSYIEEIEKKLSKFNVKKLTKRLDKINIA